MSGDGNCAEVCFCLFTTGILWIQGGRGLDALAEGEGRDDRAAVAHSVVWAQVCTAILENRGVHNCHACQVHSRAECMHNEPPTTNVINFLQCPVAGWMLTYDLLRFRDPVAFLMPL